MLESLKEKHHNASPLWGPCDQKKHEKSRKRASIACGQFLRKLWKFLDLQQFFGSFYPSMPTNLQNYPQLIHICSKIYNR